MGTTGSRHAAWLLTVWVEEGTVRGRVTTTLDVGSPRSTTSHHVGADSMGAALRSFLDEVEQAEAGGRRSDA